MYHSIILEDILDIINLMRAYRCNYEELKLEETASKMLQWLEYMCHPDGEISFFNDSALNLAPSQRELASYAARLNIVRGTTSKSKNNIQIKHLTETGYISLFTSNSKVLIDVADIGPKYLPGHGHADILSFEMSLYGQRIFVNCGTSEYRVGARRLRERGTASHNTVEIDEQNSSKIWSSFRVARRAKPKRLLVKGKKKYLCFVLTMGINGFLAKPKHSRSWILSNGELKIIDKIEGKFNSANAYFHLHPTIDIVRLDALTWKLSLSKSSKNVIIKILKGSPSIQPSVFSPEFGIRLPTSCLKVEFGQCTEISFAITWNTND